ncbi:MAG: nucleotidyl transferase AbiEii/AbiGii toxin family protein [Anaerolineae bacterium]
MKAYLMELVRAAPTPAYGRNVVREYLQARILGALQRAGAMIPLAFHGGTALRFLYASPRHSEDLDFALERAKEWYNFRAYLHAIRSTFEAEGYTVTLKVSDRKTVHSAFIRFPGLLYELGLSPHRGEVLAVKVEVDTNPPAGATLTTTVIRRHVILQLQHHDRASLFAGKLHALLQRPYTKGRDLYDLLWYLSDPNWPPPNLTLLNNALRQTDWTGPRLTEQNWRVVLSERLQKLDWAQVVDDVRPLLEPGANLDLLTPDNLRQALGE